MDGRVEFSRTEALLSWLPLASEVFPRIPKVSSSHLHNNSPEHLMLLYLHHQHHLSKSDSSDGAFKKYKLLFAFCTEETSQRLRWSQEFGRILDTEVFLFFIYLSIHLSTCLKIYIHVFYN